MSCRYDAEHGYLLSTHWPACTTIGCLGCLPCTHDEDGTETRHCVGGSVKKPCGRHLGASEPFVCQRCIGRVRGDLHKIEQLAGLMLPEAIDHGRLRSTAAELAGPAADPRRIRDRRIALRTRIFAELSGEQQDKALEAIPDEDQWHPYSVLGRWDMMLREDYDQPTVLRVTIGRSVAYLVGVLDRVALDPDQDWRLFAGDLARTRQRLETARGNGGGLEAGAPCWLCDQPQPNLFKHYGHWCDDPACDRIHPPCPPGCSDDTPGHEHDHGDMWCCPTIDWHRWTDTLYRRGVAADAKAYRAGVRA